MSRRLPRWCGRPSAASRRLPVAKVGREALARQHPKEIRQAVRLLGPPPRQRSLEWPVQYAQRLRLWEYQAALLRLRRDHPLERLPAGIN
jgi:hypothetical protein